MKLIKLNRRHKAFKDNGHKWAFRWRSYDPKTCHQVERILQDMHGSQYSYQSTTAVVWKSNFGHAPNSNTPRPYWISFTDEADASVILLKLDNQ